MAAASPFARSLLALACFALLCAACTARHDRRQNVNNCAEYLTGQATAHTKVLDPINTPPYQTDNIITNRDYCAPQACSADEIGCPRSAVGSLIKACDLFGSYPPLIVGVDIFTQAVECVGSCPGGLAISVTQYCNI
ncbi:hypothetical protein MSG28_001883 [Choristoneura fumiferana]|uniref:Uncharacterized protein n=1 Tax=Choristoneura fumiferana TaxID=7141 RepID=A0ACC0JSX9_CHOFU|nr:hypothetical protein MSG28_001883 [Choristoneura fumiferana]